MKFQYFMAGHFVEFLFPIIFFGSFLIPIIYIYVIRKLIFRKMFSAMKSRKNGYCPFCHQKYTSIKADTSVKKTSSSIVTSKIDRAVNSYLGVSPKDETMQTIYERKCEKCGYEESRCLSTTYGSEETKKYYHTSVSKGNLTDGQYKLLQKVVVEEDSDLNYGS